MSQVADNMPNRPGGLGDDKVPDDDVNALVELVRADAQTMAQQSGWNGVFTGFSVLNRTISCCRLMSTLFCFRGLCSEFTPVSYKTQVVAGVNYFVKCRISGDKFVHVRIFKGKEGGWIGLFLLLTYCFLGFSGTGEVHSIQTGKTIEDPIEYF